MKDKFFYILFAICLSFIPINANAYCNPTTKAKYNKMSANVNYTYDVIENDNGVSFNVSLLNANSNLYFNVNNNNKNYFYTGNNINIGTYLAGSKVIVKIYSVDNDITTGCNNLLLKNLYINLPNYNNFSKDELCIGIEDYQLCQKWTNVNMTYDKFKKKVEAYRKSLEKEPDIVDPIVDEETFLDKVFQFIASYYTIILIAIVVLGSSGIVILTVKEKSKKKFSI